jgi:hypothetical protein
MEKTDELRTKVFLLEVSAKRLKVAPQLKRRSCIRLIEFLPQQRFLIPSQSKIHCHCSYQSSTIPQSKIANPKSKIIWNPSNG